MFKIEYLKTGHIFELPDITAEELKSKFPQDYKILEKNGKIFHDKINKKLKPETDSIYEKVVERTVNYAKTKE